MNADNRRLEKPNKYQDERDPQTYAIIGAAFEVHNQLGPGFLEAVYQEAMEIEMKMRGIPVVRELAMPVFYKGNSLQSSYRADFLCFDEIIVEIKALSRLTTLEMSQVLNYLKALNLRRGLLINFGASQLQKERLVNKWFSPLNE